MGGGGAALRDRRGHWRGDGAARRPGDGDARERRHSVRRAARLALRGGAGARAPRPPLTRAPHFLLFLLASVFAHCCLLKFSLRCLCLM